MLSQRPSCELLVLRPVQSKPDESRTTPHLRLERTNETTIIHFQTDLVLIQTIDFSAAMATATDQRPLLQNETIQGDRSERPVSFHWNHRASWWCFIPFLMGITALLLVARTLLGWRSSLLIRLEAIAITLWIHIPSQKVIGDYLCRL